MATVADALKSARSLLNDDGAMTWSDAVLIPKLQEAHRELVLELELNHIPVTRTMSDVIKVKAGETDLDDDQPEDLVEPTDMCERCAGGSLSDFVPMVEVSRVPIVAPVSSLIYWAWAEEKIRFVGATEDREILLKYRKSIPTPRTNTDQLGFVFAELYIGPRVASLAMTPGSSTAMAFEAQAHKNLERIIQMNVTGMQSMPRRRRPYRRGHLPGRVK